jgi:type II secretory pathway pseudopilin PulG
MLKSFLRIKNQRGDTIVEVLVAIAVVSLVLASSYAITNRNVLTSQDTQEHSQALQIAQQQVELLRTFVQAHTTGYTPILPKNCMLQGPSGPRANTLDPHDDCNFLPDGSDDGCTTQPCYPVNITKSADGIYEVSVTWDSLNGNKASVSLDYGI